MRISSLPPPAHGARELTYTAAGFRKRYQNQTVIWLTQVYVREQGVVAARL
jgi:hypothetical protein